MEVQTPLPQHNEKTGHTATSPTSPSLYSSIIPPSWLPYIQLSRLDRPTGIYLFYFPFLFGSLLAGSVSPITPSTLLTSNLLFLALCTIWRGAACTWNDALDADFDRQVARTRSRPIARGAVTVTQAHLYTAAQTLLGLALALQLPPRALVIGAPWLVLVVLYPLAKRVTNYPQAVVGFVMAWGSLWSCTSLSTAFMRVGGPMASMLCLFASNYFWAMLYDGIYAHQDVKDDKVAGVKSIAVVFQGQKGLLYGLGVVQVGLLAGCGWAAGAGWAMGGGVVLTAVTLVVMVWRVDLEEPKSCLWWFKNGCWFTGAAVSSGLLGEYLLKLYSV
ncbi:Para-hydroxybenzoate--polyprenyltransferase, mitochondrial precursor (PHB:polyprenyltransferase) [Xylographa trunciseda]|nr:Para-hydroxybenzoate--polyprenyltransferase, mitochondrial precursor (PHB:polyprenyltransferase) [Xylographa trunciseda]